MDRLVRSGAPLLVEVPMVAAEVVRQMAQLEQLGWGSKRIARELGIARNTVRRYLRGREEAERQCRPRSWKLDGETRAEAARLFETTAEGNAVVVADLLQERRVQASVRTVQRVLAPGRQELMAAQAATGRFET